VTRISTSYRRCDLTLPTKLCKTSYSPKDTSWEISRCGSNTRSSEAASGGNSKHAASQSSTSIPMHFTSPCNYSVLYIYYLIEQQSPRNNGSKVAPSRTTSWILFTGQTRRTAVARGLASRLRLKYMGSRSRAIYHRGRQGPGISSEIEMALDSGDYQQDTGVARGLASRLRLKCVFGRLTWMIISGRQGPGISSEIEINEHPVVKLPSSGSPGAWHLV